MPDYTFLFTENSYMPKLISGLIELFVVFSIAWGVGWAIARKKERITKDHKKQQTREKPHKSEKEIRVFVFICKQAIT